MRNKFRRGLLWGGALVIVGGAWLLRAPLRNRIAQSAGLANPAPPPELIEDIIESAPDRVRAIRASWETDNIVPRQTAMLEILRRYPISIPLPPELEALVLAGAFDVDFNVRETAFSILRERRHSALTPLAAAQLSDPDPQVRLLGLNLFRSAPAQLGVPTIIPLLQEEDPLIVATSLKLLETWSGGNFGMKLRDVASAPSETTGLLEYPPDSFAKARAGAARAQAWWADHASEFPPVHLELPARTLRARRPVPARDFTLSTLDGRPFRLTDYRGRIVLINFWTTWCPACVSEIPELIALQKQHGDHLVVVGVSLDFVPDEHGHLGGHPAVEEQAHPAGEDDPEERDSKALQKVRAKVARTVKTRGINYPILLDEQNQIGGRFKGGELPTTILVDAAGNVRRRFVGARSLSMFEAMITEARNPEPRDP